MRSPSCERCPQCGLTTTFIGALGCQAAARQCRDSWHCRDPKHQRLAHGD